jgi:WD40 repeat protein/serine/threonine protein phosphatase PrpC
MVETKSMEKTGWRVIGKSVQGASHKRVGLKNQDGIRWHTKSGSGLPLILAVSDGHGSAKSFRSDIGANLAVNTAMEVFHEFWEGQINANNLSAIKRTAEERLPQKLEIKWKEAVDKHIADEPFTTKELDALLKKEGTAGLQAVEKRPLLAYGATLLTVLVTESFILYLQLGDGDILTVSEKHEVMRPLPGDERLFANETTSLCSNNAWRDFRVVFQPLVQPPALILLSTDGYSNSFRNEEAFLKVGPDILKMIRENGLDKVNESLETWLTEASQAGSGDDITLGIICRMDALKESDEQRPAEQPPSSEEGVTTKEESKAQTGSPFEEETDKPSEAVDEESQDESEKEGKSEDVSVPAKGDMQKIQPEVDRPKISEIVHFTEHREKVTALAFSPNGDILASASLDGTVILWDVVNKCRIRTLEEHGSYEKDYSVCEKFSVAFSHRGRLLASTSQDGKVILWAVTKDRPSKVKCSKLKSLIHSVLVREVAFFPDDEILAGVCAKHKLILWNVNVREINIRGDVYREGDITAVTVSPNGGMIVCGRGDGKVELLEVDTKKTTDCLRGHEYNVTTVSFSPDGKIIASGSFDLTVKLWDVATGDRIANLEGYKNYVNSVAFSPDGKILASGYGNDIENSDKGVKLWDVANRWELMDIEENGDVAAVAFSPDGYTLASTSDKLVKLWDLKEIRYHKTGSGKIH